MTTETASAGTQPTTATPPAAVPGQTTEPVQPANPKGTTADQGAPATQTSTTPKDQPRENLLAPTKAADKAPEADATKTDEAAKPTDAKPDDKTKAPDAEAKPLELKLPADAIIDAKALEDVKALAEKHKLAPEAAQAVVDAVDARVKSFSDGVKQEWQQRQEKWLEDIKTDTEFGGDKYATSLENAKRGAAAIADAATIEELHRAGLDRHPGLFKVFARAGAMMRDDRIIPASGGGGGTAQGDPLAESYTTMKPKGSV